MTKTKYICFTAVFSAIVCVATLLIQIPIPLGYFNIGNSLILFFSCLLPFPYGMIVGSMGCAIADLLSYPVWTVPTIIIKALMVLCFYGLQKFPIKNRTGKLIVASIISMLIPFIGYTLSGCIIYGNFLTGLTQAPGLFIEYVANVALFAIIILATKKIINKQEFL